MMLALQFRRFTAGHSAAVERHGACWIGGAGLVVTCLHCVSFDGKRWAVDDEPGEYLLSADGEPAVRLDPVLAIPAFDVALLKIRGAPARAGAPLRVSADWLPERSPWHAETRPHSLHGDGIRLSGSLARWSDRPCQPHQLTVLQGTDIDWASVSGSPVVHDESVVGMLRQQLDAGNTCFATSAHAIELTLWAARWHDTLVALRLPGLEADPLTRPARNLDRIAELLTTDGMTSAALERQLLPLPDAAARTALEAMFVDRPLPPAGSAEQDLCRRSLQAVRLAASSTSDSLLKIAFAAADAPANIFVAPRLRAVETATPASAAPPQPPQDSVDARPDPSISYEELIGRLTGAEAGELHRIAVLGEAGSGKSTLLGHLAREILERGRGLSIAFHFAQVGNAGLLRAIEAYWLPQIGIVGSRESYLLAVQRLARAGRLWIFIDGIDEVGLTHREPLEQISRSLVGALRDAHVLVASRHAYWYHGTNDLHGFRTYDLEVFTPERIFGFVEQWFVAEPDGGTALAAELKRPGRMYLLQAVRNPLRLAMLCALWRDRSKYRLERPLPSTRAELYEQFLALTYDWNLRRPKVGAVDRDALLAALSRLALQVLSNPSAEDPAHAGSFGDDAIEASNAGAPAEVRHALIEAGWVVRDGVLAPTRRRLRFAHRTWLEYFAARGLSKGIELLNLESHPPQTRFLESGWREVVLFWMGRPDVPVEEKRALLLRVVEFRDGMWGVYSTRAWQLVPACLQESTCFSEEESLMVVHELMSQAVGVKGPDGQSWLAGFPAFQAAAASALGDADPALVGRVAWAAVLEAQTLTRSPTRFWQ